MGSSSYNALMQTLDSQLAAVLGDFDEIRLAVLFGSMADGSATERSDIDLALLADEPISAALKIRLVEALARKFGRPVDIVDMFYSAEPVLGQVFKGRRIMGEPAVYARALSRHLVESADFLPIQQRILRERRQAWIK
jgi:predicted nucleotidyltransferase